MKINLKSILNKKKELPLILSSIAEGLNSSACIKDEENNVLFGAVDPNAGFTYPLWWNREQVGSVEGDAKTIIIASLLNHLLEKEGEKKKLGAEVLNLYQEINLIFNFSEKLAQTIDAFAICKATLDQAKHILPSDHGVIILWDEKESKLEVISSYGVKFFSEDKVNTCLAFLHQTILNGQSGIIEDVSSLLEKEILPAEVRFVIYASLKVNHRVMGAVIMATNQPVQYMAADLKMLTTLSLQASSAIESALLYEKNIRESKEREEAMRLVNEVTGKFVPHEFIGALGHKVLTDVKLGDQVEKIVTVLFTDIRGYTTLSEQMTPGENFKFVCSFNERMGPLIRKYNGFINQFLGDAIMAIFPNSAEDALKAAIDMQLEVLQINKVRISNSLAPIQIGIGMHSGPLIMGITGDKERLDATTISDTVNIASRLESLTKYYKTKIILSAACVNQFLDKEIYQLRYLGLVQLKGKHEPLSIFECFNSYGQDEIMRKQETLTAFNIAIEEYVNNSFSSAVSGFELISQKDPGDLTVAFFLANAKQCLEKGVQNEYMGIVEMGVK